MGRCEGTGTSAVVVHGKCGSGVGRRTCARCVVVGQWTLALRPVSIRTQSLRREASRGRGTRVRSQTGTGGAGVTGRQQGWEEGSGGAVRSQTGPGGTAVTGRQQEWEEGAGGAVRGYGNRRGGRVRQVRLGCWAKDGCPLRGNGCWRCVPFQIGCRGSRPGLTIRSNQCSKYGTWG